jgi:N-acetylglucosaminyldiphosphoundecaprenol N-acetyl-beta-D-mannosaminyltransferase
MHFKVPDVSGTLRELQRRETHPLDCFEILNVPIAILNLKESIALVSSWARRGGPPKLVTFTTVHMIMEGHRRPEFLSALREMDLNCPDGKPLSWIGKARSKKISQVSGPDFLEAFSAESLPTGFRHFFYGGGAGVARAVLLELQSRHPELQGAGYFEPPFRQLTPEEDEAVVRQINESGADVVWVCLGCPKQEQWMYDHRHRLHCSVVLAVGQAFDIVAGTKRRAPKLMRTLGLEWLYRLMQEPRRLFIRYASTNIAFLYLVLLDSLSSRKNSA